MVKNIREDRVLSLMAGFIAVALLSSSLGCVTVSSGGFDSSASGGVSQAVAKRDLGIDYLASRRTAMAIRELRAALKMDQKDPQTHLWLGEAYRRKGKTEEAEGFFLDALKLSDSLEHVSAQHAARLNLSALLSQLGRYEESLEHCDALADDPTFATPWRPLNNCGWALLQLGRLDQANQRFEDALDFFPRFGPALLNLGILNARRGQTLAAIRFFERALDSRRLNASAISEANFRLGEIYVGLGRRDLAVVHFEEAKEISPFAEWGSQSQAYLEILR